MAESERGVTNSRLLRLRLLNAVCVEWFVVSVCFWRVLCVVCCVLFRTSSRWSSKSTTAFKCMARKSYVCVCECAEVSSHKLQTPTKGKEVHTLFSSEQLFHRKLVESCPKPKIIERGFRWPHVPTTVRTPIFITYTFSWYQNGSLLHGEIRSPVSWAYCGSTKYCCGLTLAERIVEQMINIVSSRKPTQPSELAAKIYIYYKGLPSTHLPCFGPSGFKLCRCGINLSGITKTSRVITACCYCQKGQRGREKERESISSELSGFAWTLDVK